MDELLSATTVEGTVDSVVYQNEENGYTVLRLEVGDGEPVTVVGCVPGAAPGESLWAQGSWTNHPTYGPQFKADVARRGLPQGAQAIFDYLASGAVKGIGMATARKMVDLFGESTLEVLEQESGQLTRIKGITAKRAREMGEAFRLQMGMRRLLDFLTAHDLPPQLGMPLYRRFGDRALEAIRSNPYVLAEGELAVAFAQADALAMDLGFAEDHPQRLMAGILFTLTHNLDNGHTFLPVNKLLTAARALMGVEDWEGLQTGLDMLVAGHKVTLDQVAGEQACYLADLYEAERLVAARIAAMCDSELYSDQDLDKLIERIETGQGITYAPQQRQAIELAGRRQVMLLTGGPGTGKTMIQRAILDIYKRHDPEEKICCCAPTGRAARRMEDSTGFPASTIHRAL